MIRALLVLLLLASPLAAQDQNQGGPTSWFPHSSPCGAERPLLELLAKQEELLLFVGIGQSIGVNGIPLRGTMMTFANQSTGSYTMVLRFPSGQMCLIMNGNNFQPYDGKIPQAADQL